MSGRRPLSRRVMVVLFTLMIVPMAGWYFVGDFGGGIRDERTAQMQREVRRKLGITLGAALLVLGGAVVYLRRTMFDPLGNLAARAREVDTQPWTRPPEAARPDEIGDVARALHDSVVTLERRADAALQLATNLSHELRTPLAAIRGAAELLSEGELEPDARRRFVDNVLNESQRLERLASGLLEMHRADLGHPDAPCGRSELGPAVAAVVERSRALLVRKRLKIESTYDDALPPVAITADRSERILLGLLENAIKFSPENGTIVIDAQRDPDGVIVDIVDEGPGVAEALRASVFDRYFTAAGKGGGGARGTGIGLAIVQSLVTSAGGDIDVDDGPRGGARFRYRLPVADG